MFARLSDSRIRRRPRHRADRRGLAVLAVTAALLASVAPSALVPRASAAPITTTFSYAGAPVPIPDAADLSGTAPGAPATATVVSSSLVGPITDVDFSFDGSACSSAAGSTTVGLDHTFVNDLRVSLTSPDGVTVVLIANTDGSGNNFCQTVLDDESAGPSIQSVVSANAPFTGTFTPANPLSAFDGGTANGTWTLTVQDFFVADTGSIRAFSVLVTTDANANVSATKTVAGTFAEGGTVTYTIVSTNTGTATSADNPGHELTDILPAGLTLESASATSGTAVATVGTGTVTWDGDIPAGGSVTLTITATINAGTEHQTIVNQAAISYDADVNGTNEASTLSDDPAISGAADPTPFTVAGINPSVTINQAAGQPDPTSAIPIHFTAVFSEPVTGFSAGDVTLGGTAGAKIAVVSGSGSTYGVDVYGMADSGTVSPSIPAAAAIGADGDPSDASTSTDNVVTYIRLGSHVPGPTPTPTPNPQPSPTITLGASSPTVTWGSPVTLTAHVGPNGGARSIQLLSSLDNVTFGLKASLTTDANGDAVVAERPATNLYYKVAFAGAADLAAGGSNTVRVVVRQVALLRPTNHGTVKSIARKTSISFVTTVRPARAELPATTVTFFVYHRVGTTWALAARKVVAANAQGRASWTWTFNARGSWYVRSVANRTSANAASAMSPIERYVVR